MASRAQRGPAIRPGYPWRLSLGYERISPAGTAFACQIRASVASAEVIATLTSANGGIVRVSDDRIRLVWDSPPADLASGDGLRAVVMDVIRTDLDPNEHLQFSLMVPVREPVTRGIA